MTELLIQSQDTSKHFTISETRNSGNKFLAFKKKHYGGVKRHEK